MIAMWIWLTLATPPTETRTIEATTLQIESAPTEAFSGSITRCCRLLVKGDCVTGWVTGNDCNAEFSK